MYATAELIKHSTIEKNFSVNEILSLREDFVTQYCNFKGWDRQNLTVEQVSEIRTKKQWINPGMLNS